MASASALMWRPLPLRPLVRSASIYYTAAGANRGLAAISSFKSRAPECGHRPLRLPMNSLRSTFVGGTLIYSSSKLETRRRRSLGMAISAGMNLNPGGGNNNNSDGGIARAVANVVLAGGLTYLTVTGKLGWVFDTILSLWLLAVSIPIIGFIAFLWFAEREIVRGACPNCGQAFQVFEFTLKEQPNLCPYCSQPFKLDSARKFVRDEPRFSQKSSGFRDDFGGFGKGASSTKDQDPGGVIVDVEAEVFDRD